jgi:hypothetical protein
VICEDRNNIAESGPNNRTRANCGPRFAKPYTKVCRGMENFRTAVALQRIPQRYRSSSAGDREEGRIINAPFFGATSISR